MRPGEEESGRGGATAGAGPFGQPWLAAACLCLLAAGLCLLFGYYDAAFVVAALGAVAWFLNVRSKLPRPPDEEDGDELPEEEGQK
ncbi:MAG TPA: hypothetical protein VG148_03260 [Pyrinomonadaceae bacterium]|nr:hypothetical protein [Pyrinomonadaceae bacterium]